MDRLWLGIALFVALGVCGTLPVVAAPSDAVSSPSPLPAELDTQPKMLRQFAAAQPAVRPQQRSYMRFEPSVIIDATGFERPMGAATIFLPYGWRSQGGVIWARDYMCTNGYAFNWSSTSPDGSTRVSILPQSSWELNSTGTGASRPGCMIMQITSVRDYLQALVANFAPGARILVVFPASAWGEKNGTVTNSERCISRQRAFLPPAGESKPDWLIICEIARRMGFGSAFAYRTPAEIFREHARLSAFENDGARAFNLGALADLSDDAYEALAPVQWPLAIGAAEPSQRLFGDGEFQTADRRGRFVAVIPMAPANAPDEDYPLVLNTGRIRDQWHTMTRTGLSPRLARHKSEPEVEIHPSDALVFGLEEGSLSRLRTRWGTGVYRVRFSEAQKRGSIFVPIDWSDSGAADAVAGRLVNPDFNELSGQPEFKHSPVAIEAVKPEWRGFLIATHDITRPECDYWVRVPVEGGFLYELGGFQNSAIPNLDMLAGSAAAGGERIEITNHARKDYRVARIEAGRLTHCLIVTRAGSLPPREWLAGLLAQDSIAEADRTHLLSGRPFSGAPEEGALVCACFRVGRKRLCQTIAAERLTNVEAVGALLKAGTNCGSCRPEIRALIAKVLQEETV